MKKHISSLLAVVLLCFSGFACATLIEVTQLPSILPNGDPNDLQIELGNSLTINGNPTHTISAGETDTFHVFGQAHLTDLHFEIVDAITYSVTQNLFPHISPSVFPTDENVVDMWGAVYKHSFRFSVRNATSSDIIMTATGGVPEPGTLTLMGLGLAGLTFRKRNRT